MADGQERHHQVLRLGALSFKKSNSGNPFLAMEGEYQVSIEFVFLHNLQNVELLLVQQ
jgi:hypothetical protein